MMRLMSATGLLLLAACQQGAGEVGAAGDMPGDAEDSAPFAGIADNEVIRIAGTEPFWGGEISHTSLTWTTPENIEGEKILVTRFAGRGGLGFSGELDGEPLDIAITQGECSDGMSDRRYPFTVSVTLGTDKLAGCAWRNSDDLGPPP